MHVEFVSSGKVKDIYDAGDGNLIFRFSDRVSAYDVEFGQDIPRKGEVLCRFAEYWFGELSGPNHFVERQSQTEIVVQKLDMIRLECVVRGYMYGSYYDRLAGGAQAALASRLPEPVFDPSTKAEHDEPVSRQAAVDAGLVTDAEYGELESRSLQAYKEAAEKARQAGFIMADLKLEFGRSKDGIVLADSIGPDECRLWPAGSYEEGRVQEAYDKQILRDWLAENGHKEGFKRDRAAGRAPAAPQIPAEIISKMTGRYVAAYEAISGKSMGSAPPSYG